MNRLGSWGPLIFLAITGLVLWWHDGGKAQIGPPNQIQCNLYGQVSAAAAGTSSVVAGVAGTRINICGWHVTTSQTAATDTFQFEYGTQGGPCTTPTVITPALNVSNTAPSADHIDFAGFSLPAGAQLCVVAAGATVTLAGVVFYSQQ